MGQKLSGGAAAGRVAVITGGASGIGLAAARRCLGLGMKVVIADIEEKALAAAAQSLSAAFPGALVLGIPCDVSRRESVEALKKAVYEHPKLGEVGFLFSNAGVVRGDSGSVLHSSLSTWQSTFAVNVYGALHCLKAFVPAMQAQDTECLAVTTSSYCGLLNTSPGGFGSDVCYTASKHALTILTEALAHELRAIPGNKVSVACLFPAGVKTNILEKAKHAVLSEVGEKQRAERQAAIDSSRNKVSVEQKGLSPEELVQVLYDGISEGKFYIRAYDHSASFDVLGALVTERARDIVLRREPISIEHPAESVRAEAVAGVRQSLRQVPKARL